MKTKTIPCRIGCGKMFNNCPNRKEHEKHACKENPKRTRKITKAEKLLKSYEA